MRQSQLHRAELLQQQTRSALAPLAAMNNVQPFAAMMKDEWPANSFWTSMQGSNQQGQAIMEAALENQTAFADDLREALSTSQPEFGEGLLGAGARLKAMTDMFAPKPDTATVMAEESTKRRVSVKVSRL